jgi:hypothetical protein
MGFLDRFKKQPPQPAGIPPIPAPAPAPPPPPAPAQAAPNYELPPAPEFTLQLSSVGLKLMVMEDLMYQKGLLKPVFDLEEFAAQYAGRRIDPLEEPIGVVKEALDWFARYPIPQELGAQVTDLDVDMGNDIYVQLIAQYEAADQEEIAAPLLVKDITAQDLTQLPNLSEIQDEACLLQLTDTALRRLKRREVEVYQMGEPLEPVAPAPKKGAAAQPKPPNYAYQDVADEIVRIIDWHSLGIPPKHQATQFFRFLDKGLKFQSQWGSNDLGFVVEFLCVYGFGDRAIKVGLELGKVPHLSPVEEYREAKQLIKAGQLPPGADKVHFAGLSVALTVAYYWAVRTGDPAADQLRKFIFEPDPPGEPFSFGRHVFDGTILKGNAPNKDLGYLMAMWVFGSTTPEWPKDRVEAAIEQTLADWIARPGYEPWQ